MLEIRDAVRNKFKDMASKNDTLFEVNLDKDALWNLYLDSIPSQHNKIYIKRREYDCSTCRHFVKQLGNVVAINDGKVETIWDISTGNEMWDGVAKKLSDFVKSHAISNIYLTNYNLAGQKQSRKLEANGEVTTFDHFYAEIPSNFIHYSRDRINMVVGNANDVRNVFKRSLEELSQDSVETVIELINQGSLYRGDEYKHILVEFLKQKKAYTKAENKDLYAWEYSRKVAENVAKIRNTAIGTLLIDISNGVELDEAVKRFESVVAPQNYKRSKPIFTQRMIDDAKKTIDELGYTDSLVRRFANANDISVNNILYINRDSAKRVSGANDLFAEMAKDAKQPAKKFSKVEEISIDNFVKNILPTATNVEAYVEGRHINNFMSLIAPVNKDSKTMFKWDNNFSWAYSGNMTDSDIKQNVKNAGGKVDGALRFSIQWNDGSKYNQNDEDAHCIEPNGNEIFFGNKRNPNTGGVLDVDIIVPESGVPAVENITWPDIKKMRRGTYKFFVNTYSFRGGRDGFRAEIEFNGEIYSFDYNKSTAKGSNVHVADVYLDKDGNFTIDKKLDASVNSKEIWGVNTNTFIPVSVICYSPNYWNEQHGIGNKHYFFMLKDCVNPEMPNAWYNEFLNDDLYPKHRKVMEALGSKAHVLDTDDQLSGLGFSSTIRNDLVVKVTSKTERVLRVKF